MNAELGKKSKVFDEISKFQIASPPLPVDRMSWNLVCRVFIINLTICGGNGLNLKKKFLNNPATHYRDRPIRIALYGSTSQSQIHSLGKTAFETII